jgi:hypothetical protein
VSKPKPHKVLKEVDITFDDIPTSMLLEEFKRRNDLRAVLRGLSNGPMIGWDDDEEPDESAETIAAEFDAMRSAARAGNWPEFLHLLNRAMPHDLQGVDTAIAQYFRSHP